LGTGRGKIQPGVASEEEEEEVFHDNRPAEAESVVAGVGAAERVRLFPSVDYLVIAEVVDVHVIHHLAVVDAAAEAAVACFRWIFSGPYFLHVASTDYR
jgi:hypothetical protein